VEASGGKILFEGRWIEDAVRQKRAETLARRAHKEAEAWLKERNGAATGVAPYGDTKTAVTTLDGSDAFLVVGRYSNGRDIEVDYVLEVRRTASGTWSVQP
jgi:hypothetical protein